MGKVSIFDCSSGRQLCIKLHKLIPGQYVTTYVVNIRGTSFRLYRKGRLKLFETSSPDTLFPPKLSDSLLVNKNLDKNL